MSGRPSSETTVEPAERVDRLGKWSGTSVASVRGSVVDHRESVSNHAGSPQGFG